MAIIIHNLYPEPYYEEKPEQGTYYAAKAIKYFIDNGIDIKWHSSQHFIHLDNESEAEIIKRIEALIQIIGSLNVIHIAMVNLVQKNYREEIDRFCVNRITSWYGHEPMVPFVFLVNLACKYINVNLDVSNKLNSAETDIKMLFEVAKNYAAIYDTEEYISIPTFLNKDNFIPEITKMRIFDWAFVPRNLSNVQFHYLADNFLLKFKISTTTENYIKNTKKLIEFIFEHSKNQNNNVLLFSKKNLIQSFGRDYVAQIVNYEPINSNYFEINDKNLKFPNTIYNNPLIAETNESLLAVNANICAYGFFERIMNLIRNDLSKNNNFNNELGKVSEKLLYNLLCKYRNDNIKIHPPLKYKSKIDNQRYDCDAVLETSDKIIFFEIKAKSLTMESLLGFSLEVKENDTVSGWIKDWHDALLKPLLQVIRHEREILQNQSMEFENGYIMKLNNRKVIKVTATLVDFTSFHDVATIWELMKLVKQGITFSPRIQSNKLSNELIKINKTLVMLNNIYNTYNHILDNVISLNIPFLISALEKQKDIIAIIDTLRLPIICGTKELYTEYLEKFRIQNSKS